MYLARRRQALGMLGAVLGGACLAAPTEGKTYRIGVLSFQDPKEKNLVLPALARLGYVEGRNVAFEYRYCNNDLEKLEASAAELAKLQLDLIIAPLDPDVRAAARHTKSIPIVMTVALAPVQTGLIQSYAKPGGNVTGTSWWEPPAAGKIIRLLHEMAPKVRRIADLGISAPGYAPYTDARRNAARKLGMELVPMVVNTREEMGAALGRIRKDKFQAVFSSGRGVLESMQSALIELAQQQKIVTLTPRKPAIEAGFVLGYFPDPQEMTNRTAAIIDRVLHGESPAKIPVEQPMRISTVINIRAARLIGLEVPQSILLQASDIIQ